METTLKTKNDINALYLIEYHSLYECYLMDVLSNHHRFDLFRLFYHHQYHPSSSCRLKLSTHTIHLNQEYDLNASNESKLMQWMHIIEAQQRAVDNSRSKSTLNHTHNHPLMGMVDYYDTYFAASSLDDVGMENDERIGVHHGHLCPDFKHTYVPDNRRWKRQYQQLLTALCDFISYGHLSIVEWIWNEMIRVVQKKWPVIPDGMADYIQKYYTLKKKVIKKIIYSGHDDIVAWMLNKWGNQDQQPPLLKYAIETGNMALIEVIYNDYDHQLHAYFISIAVQLDHYPLLEWLYQKQCPMPSTHTMRFSNMTMLTWWLNHYNDTLEFDGNHMIHAIKYRGLELVQYLYTHHHVQPDIHCMNQQDFKCVSWLYTILFDTVLSKTDPFIHDIHRPCHVKTNVFYLQCKPHVDVYTWLFQHDFPLASPKEDAPQDSIIPSIPTYGKITMACVQWLYDHGVPWSQEGDEYRAAWREQGLSDVIWLYDHQCPLSESVMASTMVHADLHINQWLVNHHCKINVAKAYTFALQSQSYYNALLCLCIDWKSCLIDNIYSGGKVREMSHVFLLQTQSYWASRSWSIDDVDVYHPACQRMTKHLQSIYQPSMTCKRQLPCKPFF